jgi:F0F1-type ATP synthase assembly protein I
MPVKRDGRKLRPGLLEALRFYSNITLRIGISLFLGFLAGYALDLRMRTQPYLAIVGFFIGVGLGAWSVRNTMKSTVGRRPATRGRRRRIK